MVVSGQSRVQAAGYWLVHYAVLAAYIFFALFPLYWLLKVSVTPNKILYGEGVRLWPSVTTFANYIFVLTRSDFPRFKEHTLVTKH